MLHVIDVVVVVIDYLLIEVIVDGLKDCFDFSLRAMHVSSGAGCVHHERI